MAVVGSQSSRLQHVIYLSTKLPDSPLGRGLPRARHLVPYDVGSAATAKVGPFCLIGGPCPFRNNPEDAARHLSYLAPLRTLDNLARGIFECGKEIGGEVPRLAARGPISRQRADVK